MGTSWRHCASVLEQFARTRQRVEVTVLEAYLGTLSRQLRDGQIDGLIGPPGMNAAELRGSRRLELGVEPWVVLVGRRHELAGIGALRASALAGAQVAITGHRDAVGYDQAVADLLEDLGVETSFTRVGPGPSLHGSVAKGDLVALTTAPATLHPDVTARPLHPRRTLRFQLVWRDELSSPALSEFIRLAAECAERTSGRQRSLAAVA